MNSLCRNLFEEKAARKSCHNSLFPPKNELELVIETFCKSYESFFATKKRVMAAKGATTIRQVVLPRNIVMVRPLVTC